MTEEEARHWLATNFSSNALQKLERFAVLLCEEAGQQSLIARSTIDSVWSRHIVDSAQLVPLGRMNGCWLDIGSGGGLPGIVVAILRDAPLVLCEPRRRRADFLNDAVAALGLRNARVSLSKVQNVADQATTISARAVAPIGDILAWTEQNVSRETRYVLPRGRSWDVELDITKRAWHGAFHVEQSLTDPESGIVVADAVTPR